MEILIELRWTLLSDLPRFYEPVITKDFTRIPGPRLRRQYPLAALMTFEVIFTSMDDQNFSKNVRDPSLLG